MSKKTKLNEHQHSWKPWGADINSKGRAVGESVHARCINKGCHEKIRVFTREEWDELRDRFISD